MGSLLAPVANPCDKNFSPKEVRTCVKVQVPLPKQWEPVDTSPLMLNPPNKVTAVPQVPDTEKTQVSGVAGSFLGKSGSCFFSGSYYARGHVYDESQHTGTV